MRHLGTREPVTVGGEVVMKKYTTVSHIHTEKDHQVLLLQNTGKPVIEGVQWLSGSVLDSRPKGRGFEPHRRHCVVVLSQDTFILA